MYTRILVFSTKVLIRLLRMLGKNASALPGLIVETLSPGFLTRVLKPVEHKIVLITGTNGKTTSTKMLVHALRSIDRKVVTNTTGSNMTRGLISALITDMNYTGTLKPTNWFVFEMDEAYAPIFAKELHFNSLLALNVLRDQLDRYGEIDATAQLIKKTALHADTFVFNANDELLFKSAHDIEAEKIATISFGVVNKLTEKLRTEQNMYAEDNHQLVKVDFAVNTVREFEDHQAITIKHEQKQIEVELPIAGFHNALNANGVVALLSIMEPRNYQQAVVAIKTMDPPFGRGEVLRINSKNITVALVKNPSGFAHNLETFVQEKQPDSILFVINDRFADGRDVSWLWDVAFKEVVPTKTPLCVSGIRAYDMAVRLKHDGFESLVIADVNGAIANVMSADYKNVLIIPTYTALYEVRAALTKYGKVPRIW